MIETMSEIERRFDAIKDHRPRATKKLSVLGELLASAYLLDPLVADSMWRYIVDLNVSDNVAYSKFYVAQVFNKLIQLLPARESSDLISMDINRVRLLASNGYDGWQFWSSLESLLVGLTECDMPDKILVSIEAHLDKFGGPRSSSIETFRIFRLSSHICGRFLTSNSHCSTAEAVLHDLKALGDAQTALIVDTCARELNPDEPVDPNARFYVLKLCREAQDFFQLLWESRDELDEEDLRDLWRGYVEECADGDTLPYGDLYDDEQPESYRDTKKYFYFNLIKDDETLLDRYFGRPTIYDLELSVVENWLFEGCWTDFAQYVSEFLNSSEKDSPDVQLMHTIQQFMDACFFGDGRDNTSYERSMKEVMREGSEPFADSLAQVVAATEGCSCHEEFKLVVSHFIQKLDGGLHRLEKFGVNEEADARSAEQMLEDYASAFLASGRDTHPPRNNKYTLILKSLQDEGVPLKWISGDPEINSSIYRIACNETVASFLFQHHPADAMSRACLISACIREGDISRAVELVDMMPKHEKTSGKKNVYVDDWGYQSMMTMRELISFYDYAKQDYFSSDGITDDMRSTVAALVDRVVPLLPERSRKLIAGDLSKIKPDDEWQADNYVNMLLSDLETYTDFPYSKETMSKINELSFSLIRSFDTLVKINRLDVISLIFSRLEQVKDQLIGVQYPTWVSQIAWALKKADPDILLNDYPDLMSILIDAANEHQLFFFLDTTTATAITAMTTTAMTIHSTVLPPPASSAGAGSALSAGVASGSASPLGCS